jgi:2,4-dienoyl-CoA reductase-like NADH-dependent reductase (Old Yellow Enzyme family)
VVAQINFAARLPHEMSKADIVDAADRFVAAGGRVQEAGFDGVQIHAAHGFLLSGFLTPSANRRTDSYGGDAQGRRRLLVEIVSRLRQSLGRQYPILCKLGTIDGRDNSLQLEESVATAQSLVEAGIDAIEVSCARSGEHAEPAAQGIDRPEKEAYFAVQAAAIKQAVDVPIILVGGLRSRSVMQDVVDRGICDLVSACRPFIREPDLVHRMATAELNRSSCISCNQCYCRNCLRCVHVSVGRRRR